MTKQSPKAWTMTRMKIQKMESNQSRGRSDKYLHPCRVVQLAKLYRLELKFFFWAFAFWEVLDAILPHLT